MEKAEDNKEEEKTLSKSTKELIRDLEASSERIREYLERSKTSEKEKDNPLSKLDLLLENASKRNTALVKILERTDNISSGIDLINNSLGKILERTDDISSINSLTKVMTAELSIILSIIIGIIVSIITGYISPFG